MRAILMSDRPQWVVKIINGKKTLEVRNEFPSDYVGWVYIYCTKARHYTDLLINNTSQKMIFLNDMKAFWLDDFSRFEHLKMLNGKVVGRFWCDNIEEIFKHAHQCGNIDIGIDYDIELMTRTLCEIELIRQSHLTKDELYKYLFWRAPENKISLGVAIHISQLEIFDTPKELSEFKHYKKFSEIDYMLPIPKKETCERLVPLTRAPQSWQYIEVEE